MTKDLNDFKNDITSYMEFEGLFLLEHGSRNADKIAEDIISIAKDYGFEPDELPDEESEDYSEMIGYIMDEAIEYLSSAVPDGYWIGNDGEVGGFGVWKCEDD